MVVTVFRPNPATVTVVGNTIHSIGVGHRIAIERPRNNMGALLAVIQPLIVKLASARRETGHKQGIVRVMVPRVGSNRVPATALAVALAAIVSGAQVHHRVQAIVPTTD